MARPITETEAKKLGRLAERERASREVYLDDVSALHAACREAEKGGVSVRAIAKAIGKSPGHTHRILTGLTGPAAE